ncbi:MULTISPECIES: outer membrane beta-barrel protein [unclassified Photobacterium]|uniref:outer membrane beta-barrel protein n=1 Tax=unclassified Photobacterium TaxID=2628852 RepID=UPI001EE0EAA2|nr:MULTISPECIES: outer membrane beta-barrel protein [unclassified Photobacterium]MCG3864184.1 outer membrane beta-barrel protein [Photobacterium sp. Ph6]MCG3875714.1 outer membrane beta-barrel protein [Photobacterium sp. Ph5]
MSKKYIALLPLALVVSTAVSAATVNPFYVGARLGGAHYSNFQQNYQDITGINLNKDDIAAGVFAGYNFTPWFAVETGYTWLGEAKFENNKIKQHAIDLAAKMTWNLNDQWGVFGKLGGSYMLADFHGYGLKDLDDHLLGTAGVGVEYKLTNHLSTRLEYQLYHDIQSKPRDTNLAYNFDTQFYGLSLVYSWGAAPAVVAPVVDTAPPVQAATVTVEPSTVTIAYGVDGKHLTEEDKQHLQPMIQRLTRYPSATAEVTGYTSNTGSAAYNQKLSEKRAKNVADLLSQYVADASQITAKGMGEANPIATNDTAKGRAENRRVEIYSPALKIATEDAAERPDCCAMENNL